MLADCNKKITEMEAKQEQFEQKVNEVERD